LKISFYFCIVLYNSENFQIREFRIQKLTLNCTGQNGKITTKKTYENAGKKVMEVPKETTCSLLLT